MMVFLYALKNLYVNWMIFTTEFYTALYAHLVHVQPYKFP